MASLTVKVHLEELDADLARRTSDLLARLRLGLNRGLTHLQTYIVDEKLAGQVLHRRTRKLARSVRVNLAELRGDQIVGSVEAGGGVAWYGRLHEYGGTFIAARRHLLHPPHLITRRRGERVLTGSPYGLHLRERAFMRPSLAEQRDRLVEDVRAGLRGER